MYRGKEKGENHDSQGNYLSMVKGNLDSDPKHNQTPEHLNITKPPGVRLH